MNGTVELKFLLYAFVADDKPGVLSFETLNEDPFPISCPRGTSVREYCEAAFLGVLVSSGKSDEIDRDYVKKTPDLLIAVDHHAEPIDPDAIPPQGGICEGMTIHLLLNDKGVPRAMAQDMLCHNVAKRKTNPASVPPQHPPGSPVNARRKMEYNELLLKVETITRDIIRRCCPRSWDEDHITYSITDELGSLDRIEVTGVHRPFFVTWDARKFVGPTETALGDLGILVRLTSWDGEQLEGVGGLLEAKKRPLDAAAFSAVREDQLRRINDNAPRSKLLLYDHSDITDFGDNLAITQMFLQQGETASDHSASNAPDAHLPWSQAVTVPINLALALDNYRTSLYKYSIPLSVQLCGRYFRGLDLEFDEQVVNAARGFIDRFGGPRLLMVVGVSPTPEGLEMSELVNPEVYRPLDRHTDGPQAV